MAGGTAAEPAPGSALGGSEWLAIATAARQPGSPAATVRLAAAVDEATAREVGATLLARADEVGWEDGDVVARRVERLGAIVLRERPIADPPASAVAAALRGGLRRVGLGLLSWTGDAVRLRERLAFCHATLGDDWPDVSDEALLSTVDTWLGADLHHARRRSDLARIDTARALRRLLDHRQAARLDVVAPERLDVPSGSRVRLDYADGTPVLAVKLQEAFGWTASPRVADGRVPVRVHLLSPAGRALAVTSDLESFWRNGYAAVRAEMRGRYPRHPWPEDPLSATPTRRLNPRRS
jgi:ATP-dependent helicase HrpB